MLKLNLQLFASKKGVGSTKNGRDSHTLSALALNVLTVKPYTAGSILVPPTRNKNSPRN